MEAEKSMCRVTRHGGTVTKKNHSKMPTSMESFSRVIEGTQKMQAEAATGGVVVFLLARVDAGWREMSLSKDRLI